MALIASTTSAKDDPASKTNADAVSAPASISVSFSSLAAVVVVIFPASS